MDFSSGELARLRVAPGIDPLWETALSLHLLQNRQAAPAFDPWRREARAAPARAGLVPATRALMRLCPPTGYFPDFLTPGCGDTDLDTALDQVLATPRRRLAAELLRLYADTGHAVPPGVRPLAEGRPEALRRLACALRGYYTAAVEPYRPSCVRRPPTTAPRGPMPRWPAAPRGCSPGTTSFRGGGARTGSSGPRTPWTGNWASKAGR
ncbi:hypothetical protein [Streptomyces sp. Tu 2975]|uniref:hypothetical protein n=1 Tax=Streptomyces sp. Tu 2975 TaxID=2676871 RepID=UPI001FC9B4A9|nr:hypothetical protein [Streptomyces sp. Tu 2975]